MSLQNLGLRTACFIRNQFLTKRRYCLTSSYKLQTPSGFTLNLPTGFVLTKEQISKIERAHLAPKSAFTKRHFKKMVTEVRETTEAKDSLTNKNPIR
jgi:hypothetical protein